jgi:hypothetical protein
MNKEQIKIDFRNKVAKANLKAISFQDGNQFIVYIPSLNLSAYGDTQDEAKAMLYDIVLDDFFETLLEAPIDSAKKELLKYGWEQSAILKKQFSSSTFIDRQGILKNFNLSEDTAFQEEMVSI